MRIEIVAPKPSPIQRQLILASKKGKQAIARSLNRAATAGRKVLTSEVRRRLSLKVGEIKKELTIRKASATLPRATITASRQVSPLKRFFRSGGHTPSSGWKRSRRRVATGRTRPAGKFFKPKRTKVRVGPRTKQVKGGFLGPGAHIYQRRARSHSPIRKLFGPSVGAMTVEAWPRARSAAAAMFLKVIKHELERLSR